jgi:predicted nucleic acid-binding protein
MKRIYIDTSIISYITAKLSRDTITAARQKITISIWERILSDFEPLISSLVREEASKGDLMASKKRLEIISGIKELKINDKTFKIAGMLVNEHAIPIEYINDALHVAVAAQNGIDIILTWNFTHINNIFSRKRIKDLIENLQLVCPDICSPEELFGG